MPKLNTTVSFLKMLSWSIARKSESNRGAESLGVKNSKWDREDGLVAKRDCYNSYFFPQENTELTLFDKFGLYEKEVAENLDGGSALHVQLSDLLPADKFESLFNIAAYAGVPYWTTNVKATQCDSCGHINKHTLQYCNKCGSLEIGHITRIIGYAKRIDSWSAPRKQEEKRRSYHRE